MVKGDYLSYKAKEQWTSEVKLSAKRGRILDRNGNELAVSANVYRIDLDLNAIRQNKNNITMEELAGKPLDGTLDLYRNSLILWNSAMETVEVEKTCYAADIIPTLLNLFGFEYDSRLYAGRDMLSDSPSLVIFANKSFITDTISYNKKAKLTESRTEAPVDEAYFDAMKSMVKAIYDFSSGVINQNFYKYVADALPEEYSVVPQFPPKPPKQEQPQESMSSEGAPEGETTQEATSPETTQ